MGCGALDCGGLSLSLPGAYGHTSEASESEAHSGAVARASEAGPGRSGHRPGVAIGRTAGGPCALVVRRWLRRHSPEAALLLRLARADIPAGEATDAQMFDLLGVLRRRGPRDMAMTAIKVIANAVVTTRRRGSWAPPACLDAEPGQPDA